MRLISYVVFFVSLFCCSVAVADVLTVETSYSYKDKSILWSFDYSNDGVLIRPVDGAIDTNASIDFVNQTSVLNFITQGKSISKANKASNGVLYNPELFLPLNYFFGKKLNKGKSTKIVESVENKKFAVRCTQTYQTLTPEQVVKDYSISSAVMDDCNYVVRKLINQKNDVLLMQIYPVDQPYWIYEKTAICESRCVNISSE